MSVVETAALTYELPHPDVFTTEQVGWVPWLEPPARDELTQRQLDGLDDERRAASPYFRLLARDPELLYNRTRTDKGIFYNEDAGAPRADRELAAAVASRVNGCVFCASVHARFSGKLSRREEDIARLLEEGVDADLGPRWNAVKDAAIALTQTPIALTTAHVEALQAEGFDALSILDVLQGASFFNNANRLMLTLGRAVKPGVEIDPS
ncbi:alkylhydroperoxidase domain protein [Microbacterium sp. ZW T5_56]|uniref:alkylhydroperoxidase domain protein n=1 Tax=Microbacterium sp. ZW T5_56 TaxID=3378081 RepID=UPI00385472D4